jgi:carboxyl-terminal processing protease
LDKRSVRLGLTVCATLVGSFLLLPSLWAADLSLELKDKLARARELEANGEYARAWELYYQICRAERNPPRDVTEGYQFCLRRIQQARRLRDKPSQALTGNLPPADALTLYTDVLAELQKRYIDHSKVGLGDLFQYGVQEMRFALEDREFLRDQLSPDASPAATQALKARLDGLRTNPPRLRKLDDARDQLQSVMLSSGALGVKPTAVLVEFVSGACSALDEYSSYLSPRDLAKLEADLNGKYIGIGIDVAVFNGGKGDKQLIITRVYSGSPAAGKLYPDEVILSIDGQAPDPAAPGALVARLEGEAGTTVELEVVPLMSSEAMRRKVKVERQAVATPSVDPPYGPDESGVGYVHLISFQKTTSQELRSALLQLRSQQNGLKALILDLRGNLGGSFEAALQVAELFLSDGVICYTQTRLREEVRRANNPGALAVPMVVLVDGETASAAEVVAGALKDNNRATLVGQPTYGKGSLQYRLKLERIKSALQVTVRRFSSPEHVPYEGHGVTPHRLVENSTMMMTDLQRQTAFEMAKELAEMPAPSLKMPPMR